MQWGIAELHDWTHSREARKGGAASLQDVYAAVIHYIFHAIRRGLRLPQFRDSPALRKLGNPEKRANCYVHVAGTSGKGSVVGKVSRGIQAATGKRVGSFWSPHIACARERIQVNGQPIGREDFVTSFCQVAEAFGEEDFPRLNFFELYAMMALNFFYNGPLGNTRKPYCDYAVIEVGIGGLLDTTNVIERPACAVVTSIGYDHEARLGNTLQDIARQKGGIFKPGCPAVIGAQQPEIRQVLLECAHESSPVILTDVQTDCPAFTEMNDQTALAVLKQLGMTGPDVEKAVRNFTPMFRCDVLSDASRAKAHTRVEQRLGRSIKGMPAALVLDVGHNRTALASLARQLCSMFPGKKFCVLCSLSRHRGLECLLDMHKAFQECHSDTVHFTYSGSSHPRIRRASKIMEAFELLPEEDRKRLECLKECCNEKELTWAQNLERAYIRASESGSVLVICGSFFIMQEAAAVLGIPIETTDPLAFNEMTFEPHIHLDLGSPPTTDEGTP